MTTVFVFSLLFGYIFLIPNITLGFGECDQYGIMSMYDSFSNSCKCMSGYVFNTGILGTPQCVSGSSVCYDKYGYGSEYESFSNSCKCSYGYAFSKDSIGRTQCLSLNSICSNKLGYGATYNSLTSTCECGYGDVIDGSGQCTSGNLFCHRKHGLYSSYKSYKNACECDYDYTLDDLGQCVEKQHNTYFKLNELDLDNKQAIIKSEYDNSYYLISYGIGCIGIQRYLNKDIVVNLGTDYTLDTWDKIVLQNDDETCNITSKEKVYSDTTLIKNTDSEYNGYNYVPPKKPVITTPKVTHTTNTNLSSDESSNIGTTTSTNKESTSTNTTEQKPREDRGWAKRFWNFILSLY